ncbi:hypothetical protein B296_00013965 [Ensete ventricosum]|uniref:Retrotransposon gag domain-containing protein n=1 Tax=Ensete ventricosum TaxID=4639 RepID=A0A426XSW5_ENSVE|nr:hypothetical protein B296_00013965 [Ensete ventricosum]
MRVKFLRWEDGDPTGWISHVEKFFHFHRTPKESKVEITSIQLEGDAIQWHDLYETYHRVPLWGQFKRELLIHFRPLEYENVNRQLIENSLDFYSTSRSTKAGSNACQTKPKISPRKNY